jgi:hypothetical protein
MAIEMGKSSVTVDFPANDVIDYSIKPPCIPLYPMNEFPVNQK